MLDEWETQVLQELALVMDDMTDPAWCQVMLTGIENQGHDLLQPLRSL